MMTNHFWGKISNDRLVVINIIYLHIQIMWHSVKAYISTWNVYKCHTQIDAYTNSISWLQSSFHSSSIDLSLNQNHKTSLKTWKDTCQFSRTHCNLKTDVRQLLRKWQTWKSHEADKLQTISSLSRHWLMIYQHNHKSTIRTSISRRSVTRTLPFFLPLIFNWMS